MIENGFIDLWDTQTDGLRWEFIFYVVHAAIPPKRNGRGVSPASHYIKRIRSRRLSRQCKIKDKTAFGTTCLRTPFLL